jgi:hypothetical protein
VTGRPVVDDPVVADLLSRATFPAGTSPLRCAVSGGPDSTALLALAVALGRAVTVVHVDHGLRPESTADADQVSRLAAEWGAEFELHRIRVPDGGDLEARARAARHAAVGPQGLWGHTADDSSAEPGRTAWLPSDRTVTRSSSCDAPRRSHCADTSASGRSTTS